MASAEDELREELEAGDPDELREPRPDRLVEPDAGISADDEVDKLSQWPWHEGPAGVPVLDDVDNVFVGRILERVDLGDHVGHLVEPIAARHEGETDALGFQEAKDIEAGHPA